MYASLLKTMPHSYKIRTSASWWEIRLLQAVKGAIAE